MRDEAENRRVALTLAAQIVCVGEWANAQARTDAALAIAADFLGFLNAGGPASPAAPAAQVAP